MRVAVISDIHGNLPALEAVVADAGAVDTWWCLGDIVGYGADPNACVALVRSIASIILPGNHDLGAIGVTPLGRFNDHAATSLAWTRRMLSAEHTAFLQGLKRKPVPAPDERSTLAHGSLRDPIWEYVDSSSIARANIRLMTRQFCLVGHTHVPAAYDEQGRTNFQRAALAAYTVEPRYRFLCNPGAVGQPRDGDWRASYLLIDDDAACWQWRRVDYDVEDAAERIRRAGLPEIEAARLEFGR